MVSTVYCLEYSFPFQSSGWYQLPKKCQPDRGAVNFALPESAVASKNKHAAQAAGADPYQCSFTNRQSPPIQQNRRNS